MLGAETFDRKTEREGRLSKRGKAEIKKDRERKKGTGFDVDILPSTMC